MYGQLLSLQDVANYSELLRGSESRVLYPEQSGFACKDWNQSLCTKAQS